MQGVSDTDDRPSDLALDHQLCLAINRAARAINACYRPHLASIGLTYAQYTVMLVLWEHPTTTLGHIGTALGLDSGTLSPLLKRMEAAGWLERTRSDDDERRLDVRITDAGLALRTLAAGAQRSVEQATGLTGPDLADLRDRLVDLTGRLLDE